MTDLVKLTAAFPPDDVTWRVGSTNAEKNRGMALAYITARAVMDRLDEVCGIDGWQCEYTGIGADKTCCRIGILCDSGDKPILDQQPAPYWVWKADGAGDTDVEGPKGAFSDAFKRAAVKWGVGRYLYELESPWVEIEPMGRSYRIKPSEMSKLKNSLKAGAAVPTVVDLKARARAFVKDLGDCVEYEQFTALMHVSNEFLFQLQQARPEWWFGDGKDSSGLSARIEAKKKDLAGKVKVL